MVRELTGPTDDAAIIIFLNRQNIKLPSFSIDSATLKDYQKSSFCAVDNDQLTTGQRTDNQCLRNAQSQGRYLYHTPADQGSGSTKEEGQKDSKSQRLGRTLWTWRMGAIMNSQQMGLPAQGLLRSSQFTLQHEGRKGSMVLHPYLRTYWQLMSSGGEESTTFTGVVLGRLTPHPYVWAAQVGHKNRQTKIEDLKQGRVGDEGWIGRVRRRSKGCIWSKYIVRNYQIIS